jgi:hypothetical protein
MKDRLGLRCVVWGALALLAGCNPVWMDLSKVEQPVLLNNRWLEVANATPVTPMKVNTIACESYFNSYIFPAGGDAFGGSNREDLTAPTVARALGQSKDLFIMNMRTDAICHSGFYWVFALDKSYLEMSGDVMSFGLAAPAP